MMIRPFAHCTSAYHSLIADAMISLLDYNLYRIREHLAHLLPSSVQGSARSHRLLDKLKQKAEAFLRPFSFSLALMYNPLERANQQPLKFPVRR